MLKKRILNQFKGKRLAANILILVTGTVIAQTVPILLQPFLRRIYTPEEFGLFSVYLSIIGILTIFYSLRYPQTINLPKSDIAATNIFALSIILSISFTILCYIVLILFHDSLLTLFNIPANKSSYLYFVPLSSLLFSIFHIINFWLIRKKLFRLSAKNKVYRRVSEGAVNLGFGFANKSFGLVIGDLIGNTVNIASGGLMLKRIGFNFKLVSIRKMVYIFKRYSDMPLFNTIPAILNSLCLFLPAIFINKFYSPKYAGYFSLTTLVLSIPIVYIGKSISASLIQRISEKRQKKLRISQDIYKIMLVLGAVSVFMVFVILVIGPRIFGIVFGSEYAVSGEYAQIFVILAALRLVVSPLNNVIFIILERVKLFAVWQTLFFCGIMTLPLFSGLSFENFIWALVLISGSFYIIDLFMILNVVKLYDKTIISGTNK